MSFSPEEHRYDDLLALPHKQSATRPHMSPHDRAAQFAPFAALVGYEDAVRETARRTDEKLVLSDDQKAVLDRRLRHLAEHLAEHPPVRIAYFQPDAVKSGGSYLTVSGRLDTINETERTVVLQGKALPIDDILDISGALTERCEPDSAP